MSWWNWTIFALVLLIAELLTPGILVGFFFAVGASIVGTLVYFSLLEQPWLQWVCFAGFSVIGYILFRPQLWGITGGISLIDRDPIVGKLAIVLLDIPPGGMGVVEYRGVTWKAKNVGHEILKTGMNCSVSKLEGLTLDVTTPPHSTDSEEAA